jgi:predicted alpha/beta superfamily hydrolase
VKSAFFLAGVLPVLVTACGDPELGSSSSSSGDTGGGTTGTTTTVNVGGGGSGGGSGSGGGGSGGGSTGTAGSTAASLDELLDGLRNDPQKTLLAQSAEGGWPALVEGGYLFVTTDPKLDKVGGDHDSWTGTPLTQDQGFRWIVIEVPAVEHYKFTNLTDWLADPWARSYTYDDFGEISLVAPKTVHLDRYLEVGDAKMEPRTLRILVPDQAPTHVLYAHDGQNLFDPAAFFGGWKIQETVPPAMLVVGIDNTAARLDEYTHVPDVIDSGGTAIGGLGDAYGDFLQTTVRPLVNKHYGEPKVVGTMGSSLGGLISFHIADRFPGEFAFAASLSGTMGWGSIGNGIHNETMIERYAKHGHQATVLYLDSGGDGGACNDSDSDGVDDDVDQGDNYCETAQLHGVLLSAGYKDDSDVVYVWQPGAQHNEAEWAARVSVPMQVFAGL